MGQSNDLHRPKPNPFHGYVPKQVIPSVHSEIPSIPKTLMYDGVRSWEAFVTKFLKYANARGWNQQERFENICWCLEGKAGDYYPVACRGLAINDFDSLLAKFATKYGDYDLPEIMESSFQEACQGVQESVSDWADRISLLGSNIFGGLSDQHYASRQVVTRFCGGLLDKEMGEYVTRQRPRDLDEALESVKWALHSKRVVRGKPRRDIRQVYNYNMDRGPSVAAISLPQHSNSDFMIEKRLTEVEKKLGDFITKTSKGLEELGNKINRLLSRRESRGASPSPARGPGGQGICFHCQEPGHFRNECPKRSEANENMSIPTVASTQEKHVSFRLPKNGNGTETRA